MIFMARDMTPIPMEVPLTALSVILAILVGLIAGLLSSIPFGPSEVWIFKALLQKKHGGKHINPFIWGIVVGDILYAHLAYVGYFLFLHESIEGKWLAAFCSLFLIVIGAINLKAASNAFVVPSDDTPDRIKEVWAKSFLTGFILCVSNPSFLLFWLYIAGALSNLGIPRSGVTMLLYYLGIALGDWAWYLVFQRLCAKGLNYLKAPHWLWVERGVSIILILFGLTGILRLWTL